MSQHEEELNQLVGHLANEEDEVKLRTFLDREPKYGERPIPRTLRAGSQAPYEVFTLPDCVLAAWRRYTLCCLIKSPRVNG